MITSMDRFSGTSIDMILRSTIVIVSFLGIVFVSTMGINVYYSDHNEHHALLPLELTGFYSLYRLLHDKKPQPQPRSYLESLVTGTSLSGRAVLDVLSLTVVALSMWAIIDGQADGYGTAVGVLAIIVSAIDAVTHLLVAILTLCRIVDSKCANPLVTARCSLCPHCQSSSEAETSLMNPPMYSDQDVHVHSDQHCQTKSEDEKPLMTGRSENDYARLGAGVTHLEEA